MNISSYLKSWVTLQLGAWVLCLGSLGFLSFTTQAQEPRPTESLTPSTNIVIVGDTGSGSKGQLAVANAMQQWHAQHPFQTVLHLGDIIYPIGDVDTWGDAYYKKPYAPLFNQGVQFLVTLGNHDYLYFKGKKAIKYYGMPNNYYKRTVATLPTGKQVEAFVLDTNALTPTQLRWFEQQLKASTATWKIAYAHHPLNTSGQHAADPLVKQARTLLLPLLQKYQVDVYLSGHDHQYERFDTQAFGGPLAIISGGGGASLRKMAKQQPGSEVFRSLHHFMNLSIQPTVLQFEALDTAGQRFDCVQLVKATPHAWATTQPCS
ncbi:MAG: metallophosphoesterase [Vampirovibrionales bacterium]